MDYECKVCGKKENEDVGLWSQEPYMFFCSEKCYNGWDLGKAKNILKEIIDQAIDNRDREWFQIIESILNFHPVSMTEALKRGIKKVRKIKEDAQQNAFISAAKIIENEPLGYMTEEEHKKLENFADRYISKIIAQCPNIKKEVDTYTCEKIEGDEPKKLIDGWEIEQAEDYYCGDKYTCSCECHIHYDVVHCIPCCDVCMFCGANIIYGFMLMHIEESHPDKIEKYFDVYPNERRTHEWMKQINKAEAEKEALEKGVWEEICFPKDETLSDLPDALDIAFREGVIELNEDDTDKPEIVNTTLLAGTTIKINGFPVELKQNTIVSTNKYNLPLIQDKDWESKEM